MQPAPCPNNAWTGQPWRSTICKLEAKRQRTNEFPGPTCEQLCTSTNHIRAYHIISYQISFHFISYHIICWTTHLIYQITNQIISYHKLDHIISYPIHSESIHAVDSTNRTVSCSCGNRPLAGLSPLARRDPGHTRKKEADWKESAGRWVQNPRSRSISFNLTECGLHVMTGVCRFNLQTFAHIDAHNTNVDRRSTRRKGIGWNRFGYFVHTHDQYRLSRSRWGTRKELCRTTIAKNLPNDSETLEKIRKKYEIQKELERAQGCLKTH